MLRFHGLRAHFQSEQTTHGIYGTIVLLAVIITIEDHPPSDKSIVASVVGAVVAVALAEIYANYVGSMLRRRHRPTTYEWKRIVANTTGGLLATAPPILLVVLGVAAVIPLETAFAAAKWTGVAVIGAYAYLANRFSGQSIRRSLLLAVGFGVIAVGLVLFKQYFH